MAKWRGDIMNIKKNGRNDHYGLFIYGHKYGQVTCFWEDWPKCRSPNPNSKCMLLEDTFLENLVGS